MVVQLDEDNRISRAEVQATLETQREIARQRAEQAAEAARQRAEQSAREAEQRAAASRPTTSQGTIEAVIPGEQGRNDVVMYYIPQENRRPDAPNTSISVPDPQGNLDAFGNPIAGFKNIAPTAAEQAAINKFVQDNGVPQNISRENLTNQIPEQPMFKPTGNKVRIDDLPQGGFGPNSPEMFAKTRAYLSTLPNGTQVQIGNSLNEDVYVYNGGLVNSKGKYYTGYGGLTESIEVPKPKDTEITSNIPKNNGYSVRDFITNPDKKDAAIQADQASPLNLGGREYSDPLNAMYWYGLGGAISKKYEDTVSYVDKNILNNNLPSSTKTNIEFGKGFGRSVVNTVAGVPLAFGAGLGLAEAGAQDVIAGRLYVGKPGDPYNSLPDVWAKGLKGSLSSVPGAIVGGIAPSAFSEKPNYTMAAGEAAGFATITGLSLALSVKGSGVKGSGIFDKTDPAAYFKASGENPKNIFRGPDIGEPIKANTKSKTSYTDQFGGTKPKTKFDATYTEAPGKSVPGGNARAAAYDSGQKINNIFETASGAEKYADLVNEQAGGEAITIDPWQSLADKGRAAISENKIKIESAGTSITKTIEVNKKITYTPSEQPVIKPFKDTDMNWGKAQENIRVGVGNSKRTFGFKDNMKDFFSNDKGSAQILEPLERARTKSSSVEEMIFNPTTRKTRVTPRMRDVYPGRYLLYGAGLSGANITGAIYTSRNRQVQKPMQIIGPGQSQRLPSADITLTKLVTGTGQNSGPKYKPYSGTGSPSPYKNTSKSDTAFAAALGFGIGTAALARSRGFNPLRMGGVGGDNGGGYRKMFGSGMNKQKYQTGDVTSLIFGKPKKHKGKRR